MYKILIALLILMHFRAFSQPFSNEEKRILEAQDKRDASAIVSMYEDGELKNTTLVKRALTALANISDSSACETIINIYRETINSEVKSLAAFAFGQIPSLNSLGYLREIEKIENSNNFLSMGIVINTFNALGKIGDENDLERICKYKFKNDELNGALALSIARFGMRKIKSNPGFEKLRELTNSLNDANQKKWVAYTFNRIGDKDWLNDYKKELEILSTSENIFCRMWAFSALGKTGDASYTEYIMSRYPAEPDWRVKVNMLNAVGNLSPDESNLSEIFLT